MRYYTQEQIETLMTKVDSVLLQALEGKHIWNTDYVEMKEKLNRCMESAFDDDQFSMEALGGHDVYWDLFWPIKCANSHTMLGKCKKLDKLPNEGIWLQVKELMERFHPLCEKMEAVKAYVEKGRKPSENPIMRSLDHTGTCGCCNRNVKMTSDGKIWDHGYVLGRFNAHMSGFRQGSCFGVGYEPIEVSPAVWDAMLASMGRRLQSLPDLIKYQEQWLLDNPASDGDKEVNRKRAQTRFEIAQTKEELKSLPRRIKELQELRRLWKPRKLPQE